MDRLLCILTSRWTKAAVVVLMIGTAYTRNQALWVVSCIAVALITGAVLISAIPLFRNIRQTWRKYPSTPEYSEYTKRKEAEAAENDKNKIELK